MRTERDGRYDLHEQLRQFAAEKLQADPSAEAATRERHSAFYLEWLQRKDSEVRGPQQLAALAELDDEFENVRGAWEWALQNRQWKWLRTSLAALSFFITARSRFLEAITLLQHVLDAVAAVENSPEGTAEGQGLAAWALTLQSCFFGWLSQFDKQVNGLERSRAAVHQYGTPYEIVSHCCFYASTRADPEEARSLYEQALAILWAVGVTWEVGFVINSMGHFALS